MRIRIKDIAAKAGVSTGTVDRVLHNRGNVSTEVKKRVEEVMAKLGYKRNFIASALAYNRNVRISCILFSDADPYWKQVCEGVDKGEMATTHYGVTLKRYLCEEQDRETFIRYTNEVLNDQPDGVLIAPLFKEDSLAFFRQCESNNIPVVIINTQVPDSGAICYIGQDSYQSGFVAGRLINFGLKRRSSVLLLNFEPPQFAQHLIDKERGFRKYFEGVDKSVTIASHNLTEYDEPEALRQRLRELFAAHLDLGGIFVTNARAYRLLDCLKAEETKDLILVGFDLVPANLEYLKSDRINFLINQNPVLQGYLGVINLVNHVSSKESVKEVQHLPLDIVIRENYEYYQRTNITFPLDSI